jgi:hypothetical protein
MSRELKFRVYIKETSKYVYFSLGDFDYSKRVVNNQSDIPIEQFTGMMDKYNQPIYEGDVIRGMFDFGPAGFKEEILPVTWHNERGYQWDYWRLTTIEVLGNLNEWPCRKANAFDNNGECLTCDAWATDCPFLKFSPSPKLILK